MTSIDKIKAGVLLAVAVLIIVVVAMVVHAVRNTSVTLAVNEKINNTPVSVERLRQIGEWEFLCIDDEEIVDTTRKHIFSDDELIRIYYGQLRLGIDMKEMADDAIEVYDDSVSILLPEIKLLDENFIDEARTQSFYESGRWNGKDREALYAKAKRQMKERCLTKENMQLARENALEEMKKMLVALGVQKVNVR